MTLRTVGRCSMRFWWSLRIFALCGWTLCPLGAVHARPQLFQPQLTLAEPLPAIQTKTLDGKEWNSSELWGKSPTLILIVGPHASGIESASAIDALKLIQSKATQAGIKMVAFVPIALARLLLDAKDGGVNQLLICPLDNSLRRLLPMNDAEVTAISLDKFGFVRDIKREKLLATLKAHTGDSRLKVSDIKVGSALPAFSEVDALGKKVKSSDWLGRKNAVISFVGDIHSCSCSNQLLSFQGLEKEFQTHDTAIVGVSPNAAAGSQNQREFLETYSLSLNMLPDETLQLAMLLGAEDELEIKPKTILVDKNAIIRWIWTSIEPSTHAHDILRKMHELDMID